MLTATDLVDRELLDLALEEVKGLLAGTFLSDAPVVPVSAVTGEGLADLVAVLEQVLSGTTSRPDLERGNVLTVPGRIKPAERLDVRLRCLPGSPEPLSDGVLFLPSVYEEMAGRIVTWIQLSGQLALRHLCHGRASTFRVEHRRFPRPAVTHVGAR